MNTTTKAVKGAGTAPHISLWLQKYNAPGDNWIDSVGFDPRTTQAEAIKDLRNTRRAFPLSVYRLITRIDVVVNI